MPALIILGKSVYVATYKNNTTVFRIHHRSGMNFEQNAPKLAQMLTFQPARAQPTYKVLGANRRTAVKLEPKITQRTVFVGADDREYPTREAAARSLLAKWFETIMDEYSDHIDGCNTAAAADELVNRIDECIDTAEAYREIRDKAD